MSRLHSMVLPCACSQIRKMPASIVDEIPIIDLSPFYSGEEGGAERVAAQIAHAGENCGFMIIRGVDPVVPREVIEDAWEAARDFFNLPVEVKMEVPMTDEYPYGYTGIGDEILSYSRAEKSLADLKETFQICLGPNENPHPDMPVPLWPSQPQSLKPAFSRYYYAMVDLASDLMRLFALALNLPKPYFDDKITQHWSSLRSLNYPHQDRDPLPGQLRASAHTDYGALTILRQDNAPGGLQVLRHDDEWIDVHTKEDEFVINLGDLMQRWTNDKWRSTMHRVINPPRDANGSTRRQSVAFFFNINKDQVVECIETCHDADHPIKYEPITAGDHLMSKHRAAMARKAAKEDCEAVGSSQ